jgi:hypothetical protein
LTSFASSEGVGLLGSNSKPARPFGAPVQENNGSGDEDENSERGDDAEDRREDERVPEQKGVASSCTAHPNRH